MAPEATSSAAPAIPNQDRRGSDVPLMLPILLTTCVPDRRFNGFITEWRLWYARLRRWPRRGREPPGSVTEVGIHLADEFLSCRQAPDVLGDPVGQQRPGH